VTPEGTAPDAWSTWDGWESEIPRVAGLVAAVWQLTLLIPVLIYARDYRQPAVPIAVWLALLVTAAWLVPRARAGGLTGPQAGAAVAIAIGAVALVGWERRTHGATGSVDWSVYGTAWLLALVVLSRPVWVWACGAAGVFAAHAVFVVRLFGVTPLGLERLSAAAFILVAFLVVFATLRPTMRTHAGLAARSAALASRSAAEREAVAEVRAERRRRLGMLEMAAMPLLRGIAEGTLDPADPALQDRCASLSADLRRVLAARPPAAGLLAELEPALRSAAARGLPVEVQLVGEPRRPVPEIAAAALAAVDSTLSALPPHPVRSPVLLTVLAADEEVELYVAFERSPPAAPDLSALRQRVPAAARWSATLDVSDAGPGCLEVRWRNEPSPAASA
jgi:hypothetical protein